MRRVEHRNAAPRRVVDRDLVGADREAADGQHPPGVREVLVAHLGPRAHAEDVRLGHHLAQLVAFERARDDLHGVAALLERLGGGGVGVLEQRDADAVAGEGGVAHRAERRSESEQ